MLLCSLSCSESIHTGAVRPIMSYTCTCCRSAFAPPKVWCARSLNEVKNHPVDYKILSPDIYSAVSGPDIGVEFIQKLDAEAKHNINNNATSGELIQTAVNGLWIVDANVA